MSDRAKVLVAVDGSEAALHALEWACTYARMAGCDVDAVHVWGYPDPGIRTGVSEPFDAMKLEALETMRDQLAEYVDAHHPDVVIHPRVVEGSAIDALVDESHRADLLVVGRRGRGAVASTVLGSISRGVAERAVCPVVVVHPHDRT